MANSTFDGKKSCFYVKGKCLFGCEATLSVGEENTRLYVCKEQLIKACDYFRVMFCEEFKEKNDEHFQIPDETPENMICFFNAIDPNPNVRNITDECGKLLIRLADKFQCDLLKEILKHHITSCESSTITLNWLHWSFQYNMPEICLDFQKIDDDSIETLMRLCDEYQCDSLKERLNKYIKDNSKSKSPSIILNWLILSVKYNLPQETIKVCLPSVACLPLSALSENKEEIGLELYFKLMEAKCKVLEGKMPSQIGSSGFDGSFTCEGCKERVPFYGCPFCKIHTVVLQCTCDNRECVCDRSKYESMLNQ